MKLPAFARISVVLLIVGGCASVVPGARPTSTSPAASIPVQSATLQSPTPRPTVSPTPAPTLSATPARPRPTSDEPPAAALGTSDFAVTGDLGTYCWLGQGHGECVDTVGFYKERTPLLEVAPGDLLVFSLEEGAFAKWNASYGVDVDTSTSLGSGGEDVDPDAGGAPPDLLTYAEFEAPPAGDWIVEVFVRFANSGDAFYGWHVIVK